jgi:hypothetical protein
MTGEMMTLRTLLEKSSDADLLREMIGFTAQRLMIAWRPTARLGLYAAFLISLAYTVIGTILVPWMWLDPLRPMLKIGPIMVINPVALAIPPDRR